MRFKFFFVFVFAIVATIAGNACNLLPGVGNIPGNLAIDVVDSGGYPSAFVTVMVVKDGSAKPTKTITSDENGYVFFDKLDPGDYIVYVIGPNEMEYGTDVDGIPFKIPPGRTLNKTVMIDRENQRQPTIGI